MKSSNRPIFGPRVLKRKLRIPTFGIVVTLGDSYGVSWLSDSPEKCGSYEEAANSTGLWSILTRKDTPKLWYTESLRKLNSDLLLQVWDEEWIEKKIATRTKTTEKITIISTGDTKDLQTTILEEKEGSSSKSPKGSITMRDIENYLEGGVSSIPELFDLPEFSSLEAKAYSTLVGILAIYTFFLNNFKVLLSLTLGSTVLRALQTSYIDSKIPRLTEAADKFITEGFFGGRSEVHQILTPSAYGYDKNGLYAEGYLNPLPIKGNYWIRGLTPKELLSSEELGFSMVDIHIPEGLSRSPLPYRDPRTNTLIFPVGLLKKQIYFTELIKDAVTNYNCEIKKVYQTLLFRDSGPILKKYAEATGRLKAESKTKGERYLSRMCQNLAFGKFAQKEIRQVTHLGTIPEDRRRDNSITIISDDLPIWFEEVKSAIPNHLIHIAAAITSWAVIIMNRETRKLVRYGLKLSYEDTDSQMVDGELPTEVVGLGLGQFKEEFRDKALLAPAAKTYFVRGLDGVEDAKVKGIPNYIPSEKDWDRLLGDGVGFIVTTWEQLPTLPAILAKKYLYGKHPDKFKNTLESSTRTASRSFPGKERRGISLLELDNKRCHTSLSESRPWKVEELCPKSSY